MQAWRKVTSQETMDDKRELLLLNECKRYKNSKNENEK